MIEAEFQALIEVHAPIREWEPTAEDLHRLFWCQPLREVEPLPCGDDQWHREPRQPRSGWSAQQQLRQDYERAVIEYNRLRATPVVMSPPTGRWVVQIQSAGQWYDIDETRTDSRDGALQSWVKHLKVQPHLKLRVKGP